MSFSPNKKILIICIEFKINWTPCRKMAYCFIQIRNVIEKIFESAVIFAYLSGLFKSVDIEFVKILTFEKIWISGGWKVSWKRWSEIDFKFKFLILRFDNPSKQHIIDFQPFTRNFDFSAHFILDSAILRLKWIISDIQSWLIDLRLGYPRGYFWPQIQKPRVGRGKHDIFTW